jgi:hypothetical protein
MHTTVQAIALHTLGAAWQPERTVAAVQAYYKAVLLLLGHRWQLSCRRSRQ